MLFEWVRYYYFFLNFNNYIFSYLKYERLVTVFNFIENIVNTSILKKKKKRISTIVKDVLKLNEAKFSF